MFAKALLGMTPDLVPLELLDALRGTLQDHTESLVTSFLLNVRLPSDARQAAALCLLLEVPRVWALNGSPTPTGIPYRRPPTAAAEHGTGGNSNASFVSAATAASATGTTVAAASGGTGAEGWAGVTQQQQGTTAATVGSRWGCGGGDPGAREREDLLRKQAEVMEKRYRGV